MTRERQSRPGRLDVDPDACGHSGRGTDLPESNAASRPPTGTLVSSKRVDGPSTAGRGGGPFSQRVEATKGKTATFNHVCKANRTAAEAK